MTLQLPITEAMALVKENSGHNINLHIVNNKTINVGYIIQVSVPFIGQISKTVSLNITVDKVQDKDVFLNCSTGMSGTDLMMDMVLSAMPFLSDSKALQKDKNGGLIVHLNEINMIRDSLTQINISSLGFANDNIEIGFTVLP